MRILKKIWLHQKFQLFDFFSTSWSGISFFVLILFIYLFFPSSKQILHLIVCICVQNSNVENLPPQVLRLVYKEVSALAADPPEGIKIYPSEEDITELHTAIEGPGRNYLSWCALLNVNICTWGEYRKDWHFCVFLYVVNRRDPICRRSVQNALGLGQRFSCCTTQGLFPDQDFSSKCWTQGWDLCQCTEKGLEGRARPQARITGKSSSVYLKESL